MVSGKPTGEPSAERPNARTSWTDVGPCVHVKRKRPPGMTVSPGDMAWSPLPPGGGMNVLGVPGASPTLKRTHRSPHGSSDDGRSAHARKPTPSLTAIAGEPTIGPRPSTRNRPPVAARVPEPSAAHTHTAPGDRKAITTVNRFDSDRAPRNASPVSSFATGQSFPATPRVHGAQAS